jgi:hypothetical protein
MLILTAVLIVVTVFLSIAVPLIGFAAATEGHVHTKTRLKRRGGQIVRGSYIVRLADSIHKEQVRATAVETASSVQAMKQQMVESGEISTSSSLANVQVTPSLVFTSCIKGFVVTGVPDELFLSLHRIPGVITVEPEMTVSIYDTLIYDDDQHSSNHNATRLLQAKSQVTPWGIQRVKGPIKPNPNPSGRIFIIDTGIAQVSDLNIDVNLSKNFVGGSNSPSWNDGHGHGTHVSGTVAAIDNSINVIGVVPGASVVAIRVLDNSGYGTDGGVISGIDYVGTVGKSGDVANLSLGGSFSSALNNAVTNVAAKGIKFAIAAGNDAKDAKDYSPASASGANVYTVSCYDSSDTLCSFSNYGNVVDYSGPGKSVESLSLSGGTVVLSGTSMSTPHIAGLLFAGNIAGGGFVKNDRDSTPDVIAVYSGPVLTPAAPLPKPIAPKPTPAAPVPKPVQKPMPTAPLPKPLAPKPTPAAPLPKPVKPKPTPAAPVPKPVQPKPMPTAPLPKPIAPKPTPAAPLPKPVKPKPMPTAPLPKPVKPKPMPTAPLPKPIAPKPTPTAPLPKPLAPKPTPAAPLPKPVKPKPMPTAPLPKPIAPKPTPVAPIPMPTAPVPKPVQPKPTPAAPVQKPIVPKLTPATMPSSKPSKMPSFVPSFKPSKMPSFVPSSKPSKMPSFVPSSKPSKMPSFVPSFKPSRRPSVSPSKKLP